MGVILSILGSYLKTLLVGYAATTALILVGGSWGPLPWIYLKIVRAMQDFFPMSYPRSEEADKKQWPQLIEKPKWSQLTRTHPEQPAYFKFVSDDQRKAEKSNCDDCRIWDLTASLTGSGLNAIVQDDFSAAFSPAPTYSESLNGFIPHPDWSQWQRALFAAGLVIRLLFLLPIRIALVANSFIWLFIWAAYAACITINPRLRTWIAVKYSRFFCAGTGVIAEYVQEEYRPMTSGFAVSAHLTPNDAHILSADIPIATGNSYLVTGQKHTGLIGVMETMAARIIPTLWLDRASAAERRDFAEHVLEAAKRPVPVLFFPEGYCSNNTQLLQFRRAIFVRDVDIHPIAIRQDSRFGDGFWSEDFFKDYMIRLLTSWAVVYRITYLPSMRRQEDESASEFAARVHDAIAEASEVRPAIFDGSFWYKKTEQKKVLEFQQVALAKIISICDVEDKENSNLLVPPAIDRTLSEEISSDSCGKEVDKIVKQTTPFLSGGGGILTNHSLNIPEIILPN